MEQVKWTCIIEYQGQKENCKKIQIDIEDIQRRKFYLKMNRKFNN